jgi:hypothetical protein
VLPDTIGTNRMALGRHHVWIHFSCGLVFGACVGAWISWNMLDSRWGFIVLTASTALVVAFCCGRWGDSAWEWLLERLWWFS